MTKNTLRKMFGYDNSKVFTEYDTSKDKSKLEKLVKTGKAVEIDRLKKVLPTSVVDQVFKVEWKEKDKHKNEFLARAYLYVIQDKVTKMEIF